MKKPSLEQCLISVKSDDVNRSKEAFTADTLRRIKKQTFFMNIFVTMRRKMNVIKKETFIMKLRQIPKLAAIAIGFVGVIAVSGTAYAITLLWQQPQVSTDKAAKNQYGRTQLVASFKGCAERTTSTYELKKGSTIAPSDVEKVLQAKCEMESIQKWATDQGFLDTLKSGMDKEHPSDFSYKAVTISTLDNRTLSTVDEANKNDSFTLDGEAKYYTNGEVADASAIKAGDAVLYIHVDKKITHLMKVDLAMSYYSPALQNQIIERETCEGNENDTCINSGYVDLYSGIGRAGMNSVDDKTMSAQHIQATIQSHEGNKLTVVTSSGRTLQLTTPADVVADFNLGESSKYHNIKVGIGDKLDIRFISRSGDTTLEENEIQAIGIMIDFISKGDELKKY